MSIQQPLDTNKLDSPSHGLSHRVFANDDSAPVKSLVVDSSGHTGAGTETPNSRLHSIGSFATGYKEKTADYTLDATDSIINCTANTFNITLPTAVDISGREYVIINSGTGIITIKCNGAETIGGETTRDIGLQNNSMSVISDGANWQISGGYILPYVAHGSYTDNITQDVTSTTVAFPVRFDTTEHSDGITHNLTPEEVTISNASPAVIGKVAHGFYVGSSVVFSTDDALPTGITAGTVYYIIAAGFGADSFEISATPGGAAINTSSDGSGTFYVVNDSIFEVDSNGAYEFIFSAVCDCTSGNATTMDIWFRKNGVNEDRSNTRVQIATANNIIISIAPLMFHLDVGDKMELFFSGSSTKDRLLNIATQASPTRPATPSVILTIKKVSR